MSSWRRAAPLAGWLAALLAGLALFHAMGRGAMAPPPVTDPGAWGAWTAAREPTVVVAALLRLVVLALAWYLVGVITVGIVARLVRLAGLVRFADALTLPMVRRLLQGALGIGLATAMVGAATAPLAREDVAPRLAVTGDAADATGEVAPHGTVRLVRTEQAGAREPEGAGAPVAMRLAEQDRAPAGGPAARPREPDRATEVGLRRVATPSDEDGSGDRRPTHRVVAGESLWSVSQDALAEVLGREPSETEVHEYWQRTIERNRAGLADPDNPDLIFPGDELVLPPPLPETTE